MTFAVSGDAYDRFMGRYSHELSPLMIDFARIEPESRVLDVGCGPGALTARLAERFGAERVAAVDPSESFVTTCRERVPGVTVRQTGIDRLPWPDETFDAALAQLVMNFVPDPGAGLAELSRVVRPGGVIAGCTWDYGAGMQLMAAFWRAAATLDPDAPDEDHRHLRSAESLTELWTRAELSRVETGPLTVRTTYRDFDDLWDPLLYGIGPAGAYCRSLEPARRASLRAAMFVELEAPGGPFTLEARAWAVRGLVGADR